MTERSNFSYEIKEHICVLAEQQNGWKREVNIVSWNDGPGKIDIRDWDENHERMSKGITLTEREGALLGKKLYERALAAERRNPFRDDAR